MIVKDNPESKITEIGNIGTSGKQKNEVNNANSSSSNHKDTNQNKFQQKSNQNNEISSTISKYSESAEKDSSEDENNSKNSTEKYGKELIKGIYKTVVRTKEEVSLIFSKMENLSTVVKNIRSTLSISHPAFQMELPWNNQQIENSSEENEFWTEK